jgi:hypothetical protein
MNEFEDCESGMCRFTIILVSSSRGYAESILHMAKWFEPAKEHD